MTDDDLTRLRDEVAGVLGECHGCVVEDENTGRLLTCQGCAGRAQALLPLLARKIAEARGEAESVAKFAPRFWPRVQVGSPSECWPWTGPTLAFGHGRIDSPAGQTAHRYAWASANGRLPRRNEVVRHRCDNPPCCNPRHLDIGSQRDNVADTISRDRAHFPVDACKYGHPRTPENTLTKSDGTRRCKVCARAQERERRANYPVQLCPHCDHEANVYNLRRHIEKAHGLKVTVADINDRADRTAPARNPDRLDATERTKMSDRDTACSCAGTVHGPGLCPKRPQDAPGAPNAPARDSQGGEEVGKP